MDGKPEIWTKEYWDIVGKEAGKALDDVFEKMKPRRKKAHLEAAVQRECLKWLNAHPRVVYVERRNTGAVRFNDGGYVKFGAKGAADIWCLLQVPPTHFVDDDYGGPEYIVQHVEIECKRRDGKGRLSANQKAFQKHCKENDVLYLVVTSAEDLEKQMNKRYYL